MGQISPKQQEDCFLVRRLISEKYPTNENLWKWKLKDTPTCESCDMGKTDTIHHHILECPTHEHLRVTMFQSMNSSSIHLLDLLQSRMSIKALHQYLKSAREHHPTNYPDNELSTHSRKRKESNTNGPKTK